MRRTNLKGHALRSEGKPYVPGQNGRQGQWVHPYGYQPVGVALCECGWTSHELKSNGQRQAAHREHKEKIRNGG